MKRGILNTQIGKIENIPLNINTSRNMVALSFDINEVKKSFLNEYYTSYLTNIGNKLDVYEVIVGAGMYLMHGTIIPHEIECIEIEAKSDYVYFVFVLENNRSYGIIDDESLIQLIPIFSLQQMAFIRKKGSFMHLHLDKNKPSTVFEMSFSVDYLLDLLSEKHFLYQKLNISRDRLNSSLLYDFPTVLDPKMKSILYDMIYCRYSEVAKNLYIKGKLLEFFALLQIQMENKIALTTTTVVSKIERQRMMEAKDIILANLLFPPTIVELARLLGTNACYLKQNFKLVFGSTIYGYIKQVKMERARKLLMQKNNINEVARVIGYKHANHFSAAFKKHFGYVPNKVG